MVKEAQEEDVDIFFEWQLANERGFKYCFGCGDEKQSAGYACTLGMSASVETPS